LTGSPPRKFPEKSLFHHLTQDLNQLKDENNNQNKEILNISPYLQLELAFINLMFLSSPESQELYRDFSGKSSWKLVVFTAPPERRSLFSCG